MQIIGETEGDLVYCFYVYLSFIISKVNCGFNRKYRSIICLIQILVRKIAQNLSLGQKSLSEIKNIFIIFKYDIVCSCFFLFLRTKHKNTAKKQNKVLSIFYQNKNRNPKNQHVIEYFVYEKKQTDSLSLSFQHFKTVEFPCCLNWPLASQKNVFPVFSLNSLPIVRKRSVQWRCFWKKLPTTKVMRVALKGMCAPAEQKTRSLSLPAPCLNGSRLVVWMRNCWRAGFNYKL
jgi:hypothetical protein